MAVSESGAGMILTINVPLDHIQRHWSAYTERLVRSMVTTMQLLTTEIQTAVKTTKLSGQVLHVQTGTLRRSINAEVRSGGSGLIEGIVGTNVEYAAANEYGFQGTVPVRSHIRQLRERSKMTLFSSKKHNFGVWVSVRGKKTGLQALVTGRSSSTHFYSRDAGSYFLRKVNIPERSFLRSTLKEFEPKIRADIQKAATGALRNGS